VDIPTLLVTAETSYRGVCWDGVGMQVGGLRLEDVDIRGHRHMFSLKESSEAIAEVMEGGVAR